MKVSHHWLKDYVKTGITTEKLAQKLTMAGLEVEQVRSVSGDDVMELEITPNRPDCLSMFGIAREVSAILGKPKKFPKTDKKYRAKQKTDIKIEDKKGCTRYIGTLIEGVDIRPAEDAIKKRLRSLDMNPINNVVDITNFCLMETGQPLHAFDYDKLKGGKIIVRKAKKNEKITTIDGVERALDPSILVIADAQRPVAIAGVMGGQDTEVSNNTKNILLESAYFDPILIRRASRKLGLSSDSSYRFERGVDPGMVEGGAARAAGLILRDAGGTITQHADNSVSRKTAPRAKISITKNHINDRIGSAITSAQCKSILQRLDLKVVTTASGAMNITPPTFRSDLKESADIIEEIARIIGYDNIPSSVPGVRNDAGSDHSRRDMKRCLAGLMLAQGISEVITYSMINRKSLELSGQEHLKGVDIFNPLTQDQEIMRPSMLPSMLAVAQTNINRGQRDLKLFEIGKIYTSKGEEDVLSILMTGRRSHDWRDLEKKEVDFYDLKGTVDNLFAGLDGNGPATHYSVSTENYFQPGERADISVNGKPVGTAGKIDDRVLGRWNIKQDNIYFAQVAIKYFYGRSKAKHKYRPISEFPSITRDISLSVSTSTTAEQISESIRQTAGEDRDIALTDVRFVELYEGKKIAKDRRGLIFSLTYQSQHNKTLRDDEAESLHQKVMRTLTESLGAVQR